VLPAVGSDFRQHATTADVLLEVLGRCAETNQSFELVCCFYPNAPFVLVKDLTDGRQRLENSSFDVVMSVSAFSYLIWGSLKHDHTGRVRLNFSHDLNARNQGLLPLTTTRANGTGSVPAHFLKAAS